MIVSFGVDSTKFTEAKLILSFAPSGQKKLSNTAWKRIIFMPTGIGKDHEQTKKGKAAKKKPPDWLNGLAWNTQPGG